MKKFSLYIALTLAVAACVYPYNPELEDTEDASLVIDANILIGNTSTVNLSYLQPLEAGKADYRRPSGVVYLEDNAGHTYQAENRYGTYVIPSFEPSGASQYRLTVMADGNTYRSEWITPTQPPTITDVSFSANDSQVIVSVSLKDEGDGSGYASASYDEIWQFHADYIKNFDYNPDTGAIETIITPNEDHYWCWKKVTNNTQALIDYSGTDGNLLRFPLYSFSRGDNRNHSEYHALLKVWNLTPEQHMFRKQLEENASIGGNLFSPEPGEVRGNIYCETDLSVRVYGYANISRVSVTEIQLDNRYSLWTLPRSLVEVEEENYLAMYEAGYSPVDYFTGYEGTWVIGWGRDRCYDCVAAGGTLERPDFD